MRIGHILALVGAALVLVGGSALDWQTFELAGITAKGFEVPLAGQVVLGLAALCAVFAVLGLVIKRKRNQFATGALVSGVFLIGWLIYAHVSRHTTFDLMAYETVTMGFGYTLAVWGSALIFLGPLIVYASEPAWDPKGQFLRVALLWNDTVVQEKVLQEPQTFTIGDDGNNDFVLPDSKLPKKFPLFRVQKNGDYAIGLTNELDGQITVKQRTESIKDFIAGASDTSGGVSYVPISAGDWGMVSLDDNKIFFQFVQPESKGHRKGLVAFDETVSASIGVSFFVQAAFVVLGVLLWQETATRIVDNEAVRDADITAEVITEEEKIEEEKPEEETEEEEEEEEEEEVSKQAGGEEGKFGDPDEEPDKESVIPKMDGKMVDKIDVKKVGLNDLLSTSKLGGSGAIAEILNATSEGMSNKLAVAMGGEGSEFVIGAGAGGMGFTGSGSGGGGTGVGRVMGMGEIDTGGGRGIKAGLGKKRKKRVGKLKIRGGKTTGFCKKSAIASVVRRRAGAIRACYEQRLQVKKNLKGKLTARWTIALNGQSKGVSAASNSLKDSAATNCILRILRRMRFKKPEGGVCVVQWPFVFSPG